MKATGVFSVVPICGLWLYAAAHAPLAPPTTPIADLLCPERDNLWFGGFPYTVNPGRPEWSKVQTRGKPLVATAQAKYMSAGEQ